jgi:hypothetical protein
VSSGVRERSPRLGSSRAQADLMDMSTAAHVIDLLTSPGTPAPTRLRLAAERLADGPTPADSPNLIARLAEVVNGSGGDERVQRALHVFDSAA